MRADRKRERRTEAVRRAHDIAEVERFRRPLGADGEIAALHRRVAGRDAPRRRGRTRGGQKLAARTCQVSISAVPVFWLGRHVAAPTAPQARRPDQSHASPETCSHESRPVQVARWPRRHRHRGHPRAPVPQAGQALVRVKVAALNFLDTLMVRGKYQSKPELPFSPASEFAGVVEAVGAGVTNVKAGRSRVRLRPDGCRAREDRLVPPRRWSRSPAGVADEVAAGIAVTYGTGYYGLKDRAT